MKKILSFGVLLSLAFTCRKPDPRDENYGFLGEQFADRKIVFKITDPRLSEVSGICLSRSNPGYFWMHNDSGDKANLYLVDSSGEIALTDRMEAVKAYDWEEMSIGTIDSVTYLFVGDTGDNQRIRDSVTIYKIKEPILKPASRKIMIKSSEIERMTFTYQEGPKDVEAFFFDPASQAIILFTKRDESSSIYSFPFDPEIRSISSIGTIDLKYFTSATINGQGEILIKNYESIFYWETDSIPTTQRIRERAPHRIPYKPEPQGEAICWDENGSFYTISEYNGKRPQKLFYYRRIN